MDTQHNKKQELKMIIRAITSEFVKENPFTAFVDPSEKIEFTPHWSVQIATDEPSTYNGSGTTETEAYDEAVKMMKFRQAQKVDEIVKNYHNQLMANS
jgi:hypothetical protein